MLMKLDAREAQHQLKVLRQTKALYDRHLMGGLMYLEAVKIINKDPSLIRKWVLLRSVCSFGEYVMIA